MKRQVPVKTTHAKNDYSGASKHCMQECWVNYIIHVRGHIQNLAADSEVYTGSLLLYSILEGFSHTVVESGNYMIMTVGESRFCTWSSSQ